MSWSATSPRPSRGCVLVAKLTCKDLKLKVGDRIKFRGDPIFWLVTRVARSQFWIDPWEDGPYSADAVEEVRS
jgi:hypothetical protein